ncbi:hypothetical protein LEP1GSC202_1867 [Leptospira yanagawae serovar Saopaulo str. Sao Paulo = ATCC 700523]|uniref:Uncharacterized protein n=1 Tax=Leptospira yanagawae serovar Saopaulo str. Sao Paulo = ATCC 700523 TaxID=1249483 RepID=A0A5E8HF17_9LEPT|nr:hypothetical protein LEP1GSC202_1867 [Leptospira yanagawae serovar Saopaulo str. Sao Paulo = ATCC 700523]
MRSMDMANPSFQSSVGFKKSKAKKIMSHEKVWEINKKEK